ncbi:hypothetical protein DdX_14776 [Ditylenchus destructor]|uniref:Uncharacterized protein n=1 Tax=Ditylenchus destructor TaxID=166010 RepID=A0AAD4MW69_9BILA|nr:hypothetical protein DdX_14776 [Ditylenchus destructor]
MESNGMLASGDCINDMLTSYIDDVLADFLFKRLKSSADPIDSRLTEQRRTKESTMGTMDRRKNNGRLVR